MLLKKIILKMFLIIILLIVTITMNLNIAYAATYQNPFLETEEVDPTEEVINLLNEKYSSHSNSIDSCDTVEEIVWFTNKNKTSPIEIDSTSPAYQNAYNKILDAVEDKLVIEVQHGIKRAFIPPALIEESLATLNRWMGENKTEAAEKAEEDLTDSIGEYADSVTGSRNTTTFTDILDNVEGYDKPEDLDAGTANKIEAATSTVLTVITNIGIVIAIVILAVLGIKYMLGSVEEKAEYKKDLVPYLIGAGLLFGILTFIKIFMQWGETLSNI